MTCLHRHARLSLRTFCAASTACGAVSLLRLSPLNFDFRLLPVRFGLTLRPARASDSRSEEELKREYGPSHFILCQTIRKGLPIPRMRERIKLTQQGLGCGWKPTAACTTASQREHEQRGRR